jgi:hypothetical protein
MEGQAMLRKTIAVGGLAAAGLLGKRVLDTLKTPGPKRDARRDLSRWRAVTVNLPPEQVAPDGKYPEPLAELGDKIEFKVRPAAARGTELAARPAAAWRAGDGKDLAGQIRKALRQSKMLLETGEVLRNEPAPHGKRPATPAGKIADEWEKRAQEGGIL